MPAPPAVLLSGKIRRDNMRESPPLSALAGAVLIAAVLTASTVSVVRAGASSNRVSPPAPPASRDEIFFFCGSAVKVPMEEIIAAYSRATGARVGVVYGGSGTLLSQMELSRRGDVYLCGSPDYIIIGERKKLLIAGTAKKIAYLVPAIIVPAGNPGKIKTLDDLARPDVRVGIGNPETVCLGLYSVEIFEANGLLGKILPNVKVFAKSCEDTATLAVLGNVDAILGWGVFKSWNPSSVELVAIEKNRIPRLAYIPVAVPVYVKNRAAAEKFIDYLMSAEALGIWRKWGYISDVKEAKKYAPAARVGGEYKIPVAYYEILKTRSAAE